MMVVVSYIDMVTDVGLAVYLLTTPQAAYGHVSFGIIIVSLVGQAAYALILVGRAVCALRLVGRAVYALRLVARAVCAL